MSARVIQRAVDALGASDPAIAILHRNVRLRAYEEAQERLQRIWAYLMRRKMRLLR